MSKRRSLNIENLESRQLLATYGVAIGDARHLTLSFAPDGTPVAGHASDLFQSLDSQSATADWQRAILRGFQTWAVNAKIDIGIKADSGDAFGTPGLRQGDARFGDIRVGAQNMSSDALSISVPNDPFLSGTWAGDVLLNDLVHFDGQQADLYSVVLHEAGHVFGLDHSTDPNSVMYSHANQIGSLSTTDIERLQALYGKRTNDQWDTQKSNGTLQNATRIKLPDPLEYNGSTPVVMYGDITTLTDVDFYSLRPLLGYDGPISFRLQTAGISLLTPRLTILDSAGRTVAEATSNLATGDVLTLRLDHPLANKTYYVKVSGASNDVFGIGRYGLAVTFDDRLVTPASTIDSVLRGPYESLTYSELEEIFERPESALFNDDLHTDDTAKSAATLKSTPGYAQNSHYQVIGSLADAKDKDFYRLLSAKPVNSQTVVMTATVVSLLPNGTLPQLTLLDSNFRPLASRILANGNGTFTVQAADLKAGDTFLVQVASNPSSASKTGNYSLSVDFGTTIAAVETFATSTLDAETTEQVGTLYIGQSQLAQFMLSVDPAGTPTDATVRLTITDELGQLVLDIVAHAGETLSASTLLLVPGAYTARFSIQSASGAALPSLGFSLLGMTLSDPIGPVVDDPTLAPKYVCMLSPMLFCYPTAIVSSRPILLILPVAKTGG